MVDDQSVEGTIDLVIRRYASLLKGWHEVRVATEARLKKGGVTANPIEIVILHSLLLSPELSLRLSEICLITGYSRASMASAADALHVKGHTAKMGGGVTGTPTEIFLTVEGEEYIKALRSLLAERHKGLITQGKSSPSGRGVVSEMYYAPSQVAVKSLPEGSFARQYLDV